MLWITPAWLLSLVVAALVGYHFKRVEKKVEQLEAAVKLKVDKPVVEEPKSMVIDPDDEIQTALYEHEQMMKRLNPDE